MWPLTYELLEVRAFPVLQRINERSLLVLRFRCLGRDV
jgi:hypothetical protein